MEDGLADELLLREDCAALELSVSAHGLSAKGQPIGRRKVDRFSHVILKRKIECK